ncbi:TRAP transporter small permease [Thalassobius sp. I31.1]|uniref:TRAP transporter small permease subunit n=1 Tax=Thalassobius sp. I31.1 TaxID=2109912 RepID=UPI001E55B95F|nr:TRAP transporter small permease [Thalassobius sp. I31.1]
MLLSVCSTLFDIVARQFHLSLGGTDELSGYAMAIATSWGVAYTLIDKAHVRIDIIRSKANTGARAVFDCISITALAGTALFIAVKAWPVLEKSIRFNSTANTTMETPLWIPQSLWLMGWGWFAFTSSILAVGALWSLIRRDFDAVETAVGMGENE